MVVKEYFLINSEAWDHFCVALELIPRPTSSIHSKLAAPAAAEWIFHYKLIDTCQCPGVIYLTVSARQCHTQLAVSSQHCQNSDSELSGFNSQFVKTILNIFSCYWITFSAWGETRHFFFMLSNIIMIFNMCNLHLFVLIFKLVLYFSFCVIL